MSSEIIKELVSTHSVENLLAEMETQLDVLAKEFEQADLPKSSIDYRDSARKINRLRTVDKFIKSAIKEYEVYSALDVNKEFNNGVISGLKKVVFFLYFQGK